MSIDWEDIQKAFDASKHPRGDGGRFVRTVQYAGDYVLTKDGSRDFGEIDSSVARQMRRQAGKIRMRKDGEAHIERPTRLAQIQANGYACARDLVEDVCSNYDAIYKGKGATLILYKKGEKDTMCYVQLVPADDDEDFYDVKTALVVRKDYTQNKTPLWSKSIHGVLDKQGRAQSNQQKPQCASHKCASHKCASHKCAHLSATCLTTATIPQSEQKSSITWEEIEKITRKNKGR